MIASMIRNCLCALVAAGSGGVLHRAQAQGQTYTTTEIKISGATNVTVSSLNNRGVITGSDQTNSPTRGFVMSQGSVTPLAPVNIPGAGSSYPWGVIVNDANVVLGSTGGVTPYGTLSRNGKVISYFQLPIAKPGGDGAMFTGLAGFNRFGVVLSKAGRLPDLKTGLGGEAASYVGTPPDLREIKPPADAAPGVSLYGTAINAHGMVVGLVYPEFGLKPATMIFSGGVKPTRFFRIPGTISLGGSLGLNNLGQIAGDAIDTKGAEVVFSNVSGRLTLQSVADTTADLAVRGINDRGEIAVTYRHGGYTWLSKLSRSGQSVIGRWVSSTEVLSVGLNNWGGMIYALSDPYDPTGVHSFSVTCRGC